jgi:hypothetical protein
MSCKLARSRGKRKHFASQFAFHCAEVSETTRTTGLLDADACRRWAMARAAQLADYERRRGAATDLPRAAIVTADHRLLARWDALRAALREAA